MVIDCHGHMSAPEGVWAYRALLTANRGVDGPKFLNYSDSEIEASLHVAEIGAKGHLELLDDHGIDMQLISPRPFHSMHSEQPETIVKWFHQAEHDVIARIVELHPDRFQGLAFLPQCAGRPIDSALDELDRCITQLGFHGCLINPDPYEMNGVGISPGMGERYWYPLYEKLCDLDIPGIIHATTSKSPRFGYSIHMINEESIAILNLLNSSVFIDFPELKIVIPHGGGSIPYQIGRFEADTFKKNTGDFKEKLRKLYFDTVLYSKESIEYLIKLVGADRCLFGSECPGVAAVTDPRTGKQMDDLVGYIRDAEYLTDNEKEAVLSNNSKELFKLK